MKISYGSRADDVHVRPVDLAEIVEEIRSGKHREKVERIRSLPDDSPEQKAAKKALAYFVMGKFNGPRSNNNLIELYGVVLDLDHLNGDPAEIRRKVESMPTCLMAFYSPRKGLKVAVHWKRPITSIEHDLLWPLIADSFEKQLGHRPDESAKAASQACFLSYDPAVYTNPEAVPLDPDEWMLLAKPMKDTKKVTFTGSDLNNGNKKIESAVSFLVSHLAAYSDYDTWLKIGLALSGLGEEGRAYFLQLSLANHDYQDSEAQIHRKFDNLLKDYSGKIKIGTLFHIAKKYGWQYSSDSLKPSIFWTTGSYSEIAAEIGSLMAKTGRYYLRSGGVCEIQQQNGAPLIKMLRPAEMCSRFESVAVLLNGKEGVTRATEQQAKMVILSESFQTTLPDLTLISPCPVLIETNGKLVIVTGYDSASGIWASGDVQQDMSLDEARQVIYEILQDFNFVSKGDHARAFAALITPALIFGGIINGRAPLFMIEADFSQAGKGFFNKLLAAIFGLMVTTISQRKGGVGSMEEGISRALISGALFISLDNLRGKIDLPSLESLLTEDVYLCRVPYQGDMPIDPRRYIFMATSNKADFTRDLANRSCIVRLKKQAGWLPFQKLSGRKYP